MTLVFESLTLLQNIFGFQKYDEEGYPIEDDYMDDEEGLDEDLDDGFDNENIKEETEWE